MCLTAGRQRGGTAQRCKCKAITKGAFTWQLWANRSTSWMSTPRDGDAWANNIGSPPWGTRESSPKVQTDAGWLLCCLYSCNWVISSTAEAQTNPASELDRVCVHGPLQHGHSVPAALEEVEFIACFYLAPPALPFLTAPVFQGR